MKLYNLVTSLDFSKKLKKIGVKQESLFYWVAELKETYVCQNPYKYREEEYAEIYSAFTAAELLDLLPDECGIVKDYDVGFTVYGYQQLDEAIVVNHYHTTLSAVDALAELVINMIAKGFIKLNEAI